MAGEIALSDCTKDIFEAQSSREDLLGNVAKVDVLLAWSQANLQASGLVFLVLLL